LKPLVLEVESLSTSRCLIRDEFSKDPIFIIDLGATKTSFMVFHENSLKFNFFIPVSSNGFTENIAREMNISLAKAEKLKQKYGLETNAQKEGGEIFETLTPALTDLIEQIKKYIDYYHSHSIDERFANPKISRILLSGGGANLRGLGNFIAQELKIPVEIGNPWINIFPELIEEKLDKKLEKLKLPLRSCLSYSSAIGLALRGVNSEKEDD